MRHLFIKLNTVPATPFCFVCETENLTGRSKKIQQLHRKTTFLTQQIEIYDRNNDDEVLLNVFRCQLTY